MYVMLIYFLSTDFLHPLSTRICDNISCKDQKEVAVVLFLTITMVVDQIFALNKLKSDI